MLRSFSVLMFAILMAVGWGCATPVPPSGGPADELPPEVLDTRPARGAVNVDATSMRITFSEYVDDASLPRALSISPAFVQPLDYSWSGRSVEVRFPEPLRENTTYVLTMDTNLRDAHNVALRSPIILAFSTGPTISAGRLAGRLVSPDEGASAPGIDMFAYARPDSSAPESLPDLPAYATQTDDAGAFTFEYLTEQYYYVVAVEDANRNRQPDPAEAFATPPSPALFADSMSTTVEEPWILARLDTTAPGAIRVQSLSDSRHAVRFSEPVRLVDREPSTWVLTDSASGASLEVRSLYQRADEPRDVLFTTERLGRIRYSVEPAAIVDTSGNAAPSVPIPFTADPQEDTLQTRFVAFLPSGSPAGDSISLPRGVEPGVRFNAPPGEELLRSAVAVADTVRRIRSYAVTSSDGTAYEILPDPELQPGDAIEVAVDLALLAGPDSVLRRTYQRLSPDDAGEISGVVETISSDGPSIVVQLIPVDVPVETPEYQVEVDLNGAFAFRNLPAGTFRLRAFVDENANGKWDPGLLTPYRPAERIVWRAEPVRVRARWETALPDTLRVPEPK